MSIIFGFVLITPVNASITPIFSIPGNTSLVFPSEEVDQLSYIDYGPLNVPDYFQNTDDSGMSSQRFEDDAKYNLITFVNPISVGSDNVNIQITLYGTLYNATLQRINFKNIDDGVYSYIGNLDSLENSSISLVATDAGLIDASIEFNGDSIVVMPVQNREYTQRTPHPLHIVYSENSLPQSDSRVLCGMDDFVDIINGSFSETVIPSRLDISSVQVNILFATDSEFYGSQGNWITKADKLITQSYNSYARSDIKVYFNVVGYDISKMNDLDNHPLIESKPFEACDSIFSNQYLNGKNADIVMYLGGYDADNDVVGEGDWPTNRGRAAWMQMIPDGNSGSSTPYTASEHSKGYLFTHELGHNFGATHPKHYVTLDGRHTVMSPSYVDFNHQLYDFSTSESVYSLGNAYYDNANLIRQYRSMVSNYA